MGVGHAGDEGSSSDAVGDGALGTRESRLQQPQRPPSALRQQVIQGGRKVTDKRWLLRTAKYRPPPFTLHVETRVEILRQRPIPESYLHMNQNIHGMCVTVFLIIVSYLFSYDLTDSVHGREVGQKRGKKLECL